MKEKCEINRRQGGFLPDWWYFKCGESLKLGRYLNYHFVFCPFCGKELRK